MQAVLFIGTQASGKSGFFRELFFDTHVRVNLDMLRTRNRERLLIEACIAGKQQFVVDNTNLTAEDRRRYIIPARAAGFFLAGYYFHSTPELSLRRNAGRIPPCRVPEKGILSAYKRLQLPDYAEGFDALYHVVLDEKKGYTISEWKDEIQ